MDYECTEVIASEADYEASLNSDDPKTQKQTFTFIDKTDMEATEGSPPPDDGKGDNGIPAIFYGILAIGILIILCVAAPKGKIQFMM